MAQEEKGVVSAPPTQEAESGVGDSGNISLNEIGGIFAQEYPAETEAVSEEGKVKPDEQVATGEAETEADSQVEESLEAETEEVTEDSGAEEEDADDEVLSQLSEHAAKRARKRIDKLTARAKTAEEAIVGKDNQVAELTKRLDALEHSNQKEEASAKADTFADRVKLADTPQDLKQLRDIAWETKAWCREHWGEEYVEMGEDAKGEPKVIDRKELAQMLNEAERVLDRESPDRARHLQKQQAVVQNAIRDFPAWQDKSNPDHDQLVALWNNPENKAMLRAQPNGMYLTGIMLEGLKAMNANQPPAEKPAQAKKVPIQRVAPKIPGVESSSAPTGTTIDSIEQKVHGNETLSSEDMVAYFAHKDRAKRNRKG